MLENELSKIWKSSPKQEQVKFDKSRFMLDVQSSVDDFHKQMKSMYIRESLGVFIVVPMFSYYAFNASHILTKIGFILVALSALYILYVMKKSKDKVPNKFSMSYLEYLQKTKEYLEDSKKNRETVIIWYILPIVLSLWIAMIGMYLTEPNKLNGLLIMGVISVVISIVLHFLNKRSAKKFVVPKLEKVNSLIENLKE
ncbi:hypothetical protein WAF17_02000 [Bernardetia sp. ABR2-2B]|uniref:hypothetical protein n=1 Tax=Bernardetia sp. ABR2-2B TaxID=3127472 RepID=UPI0030D27D01